MDKSPSSTQAFFYHSYRLLCPTPNKATLQQLGIKWHTEYVKRHQTKPNLSWEAQLKNKADVLATEAKSAIYPSMAKS
eukprot:11205333-Ditylum_brightwellii.AAC.1